MQFVINARNARRHVQLSISHRKSAHTSSGVSQATADRFGQDERSSQRYVLQNHATKICCTALRETLSVTLAAGLGANNEGGYFTQEQYVNDRDFLLNTAKQAGLPEDQAAAVLDDPNAMRAEVEQELREARMQAVSGVPYFTIGNKHQLSGAQDPSTFMQVFQELA